MFDSPQLLKKIIQKRVLTILAVISGLSLLSGNDAWMWGILLGGFCALAHFRTICMITEKVVDLTVTGARIRAVSGYLFRYVINALILAYSYFQSNLSFLAVVIGLLLVKIVIITEMLRLKWVEGLDGQLGRLRTTIERRETFGQGPERS